MGKNKENSSKEKSSKSSKHTKSSTDASKLSLTASSQAIDPSLDSLFGSSLGPVKAPERTYTPFEARKPTARKEEEHDTATTDEESDGEDEANSEARAVSQPRVKDPVTMVLATTKSEPERRAKRKRADDDLEERYMQRLQEEEDVENKKLQEARKAKQESQKKSTKIPAVDDDGTVDNHIANDDGSSADTSDDHSDEESDDEGEKRKKGKKDSTKTDESSEPFPIRHETLQPQKHEDLDEAARTVFLGNVPSIAISSKTSYKTLKSVFSAPGKIKKIRFRSVAFSEQIPRKAAFATHKLHEKQQTVNAYVVYETKDAAREALKLNGSVVLDRHIRVDSVAHPAKHDTHRSIFIGNLDFEAQEESLWRHFAPCGKIEYVRIVRDSATNVGKGFAYVQFEDVVSVEQALLLDGQKMQKDRKLRVTRAKNIKRKNKPADSTRGPPAKKQKVFVPKDDPRQKAMLGRARKLLGKAGAAKMRKAPESFIFEGTRATATDNPGVKLGSKKKGKPVRARANARSSTWKQKNKK